MYPTDLAIIRNGESSEEKGVSSKNPNFNRLLAIATFKSMASNWPESGVVAIAALENNKLVIFLFSWFVSF